MTEFSTLREQLIILCVSFVDQQITNVQNAINSAKESAQNESKSSAGDKHETGKSLMQLEQENNSMHLDKMRQLQRIIPMLQNYKNSGSAALGSIVETTDGIYYMALGIGPVTIAGIHILVISPGSPIGKLFQGKKVNERFQFGQKSLTIVGIY